MGEELIAGDIRRAKELNPDFVVVLPHMGNEYESAPRQIFKDWVNLMFTSGADIVLASHPHVLQPVEFANITDADGTERICFAAYSLGNFISSQRTLPRDAGMILNIDFEKTEGEKAFIKSVSYIPTWVQFVDKNGSYHITVLSVGYTLKSYAEGAELNLRISDINRIKTVQAETTKMISGEAILGEMKSEYYIYSSNEASGVK